MNKLRIGIVSNYYPPHFIGGYELGCKEVAQRLKARGHDVKVLTSTYKVGGRSDDGEVYRWLKVLPPWEPVSSLGQVIKREISSRRVMQRFCALFKPEVVYVWNPVGISLSIVSLAQESNIPVCYFVSDHWLSNWETDFGYEMWKLVPARTHRRVALDTVRSTLNSLGRTPRPQPPDLRHVHFASNFLKQEALQAGKPVAEAQVIHWGIDADLFQPAETTATPLRLLYVGQLMPHKGVHTAIEALGLLVKDANFKSATLTIAGVGVDPDYESRLRAIVSELGLADNVSFAGLVPRDQLASLYRQHAILILPSIWDEPFSITVLEAMSSGLAVVGTPTGGSAEILNESVNALIFPKEDARKCAEQILRLWQNPQLLETIRQNARRTIDEGFRTERMVDSIEQSLMKIAGRQ
jgi:glycosyltransferase involved in cell wall biosynthesis